MAKDFEVLSKGAYRHSQINDFIHVKQFIFSKRGNRKYLALNFENGADADFDSIAFTVTLLDAKGRVIEKIPITCKRICVRAGECYAYGKLIRVKPECSDFTVVFDEVYSGDVVYTEEGGRAVARYAKRTVEADEGYVNTAPPKPAKKHRVLMKLVAIIALAIVIGSNVWYITDSIREENEIRREAYNEYLKEKEKKENNPKTGQVSREERVTYVIEDETAVMVG